MRVFIIIWSVLICVLEISSMAIKGPALTRYDPCNLGVIHFDKIVDNFWQGEVNLNLYPNITNEVAIGIDFETRVEVYSVSQNTTLRVLSKWHNFVFKPQLGVPPYYTFKIKLIDINDTVPSVSKFSLNNVTLCDDVIKASQTVESLNVTESDTHYKHMCGRRSLEHAELTSVKTDAKAGDWPWHVAIFVADFITNITFYQCGGSIISRTAIVTAGHCITQGTLIAEPHMVKIIAGIDNRNDLVQHLQIGRQELLAEKVIRHPNYQEREATADLAIIKVNKMKFTEYVQPICIWGPVYDKTNLIGFPATVVGFGTTEMNRTSDVLRSAYTVVQNDTTCINFDPNLYGPLLNEFTFCGGYGPTIGINPRNGDSGGGLIVPTMQPDNKISWFLRGVVSKCGKSAGYTNCDPHLYIVYTDVGPHYGWLYHHSGLVFRNNIMQ